MRSGGTLMTIYIYNFIFFMDEKVSSMKFACNWIKKTEEILKKSRSITLRRCAKWQLLCGSHLKTERRRFRVPELVGIWILQYLDWSPLPAKLHSFHYRIFCFTICASICGAFVWTQYIEVGTRLQREVETRAVDPVVWGRAQNFKKSRRGF